MRKSLLGSAILVAVLSGCGGGGSPESFRGQSTGLVPVLPSPLPARRQTIVLTGQAAYLNDQSPAAGVSVRLGRAPFVGVSDASGAFRIVLPTGASVASLLCNSPRTFSVAVPSSGQWKVIYQGGLYPAESVPLPADIVWGRRTGLGLITIAGSPSADDDDTPPPPPSFEQ